MPNGIYTLDLARIAPQPQSMNLPSLPTTQADLAQLADARGESRPGAAYVLTPFDTWERNPHYDGRHGPFERQPHPEDDFDPMPSGPRHRGEDWCRGT